MAHRTKWYEERVRRFLENGGADSNGASTATEIIEYLRNNCGKRQLPSTGAISHSLRGVRDMGGNKVFIEVGQTKVARGDSRRRGYMVSTQNFQNFKLLTSPLKRVLRIDTILAYV